MHVQKENVECLTKLRYGIFEKIFGPRSHSTTTGGRTSTGVSVHTGTGTGTRNNTGTVLSTISGLGTSAGPYGSSSGSHSEQH